MIAIILTCLAVSPQNADTNRHPTQWNSSRTEPAEEDPILPQRKLFLDFANPVKEAESNTNAWYSAQQLVGKTSDLVGLRLGADESFMGRLAVTSFTYYILSVFEAASHELAHTREAREFGPYDIEFELNSFTDFNENLVKQYGYTPTNEQYLLNVIAGLNQDEFNAYTLFLRETDELTVDEALAFLLAKAYDILYNTISEPDEEGDVRDYVNLLKGKGIGITKRDHLTQALVADMFTVTTWYSAHAIVRYLAAGHRVLTPLRVQVGELQLSTPLLSHYLTPDGGFYNVTTTVHPAGNAFLELSLGTDVDFIGDGKLKRLRFGGQLHNLGPDEFPFRISPFVYVDLEKPIRYDGISIGTEILINFTADLALRVKVDYSNNDVVENLVKGKDDGINVLIGVRVNF